MPVEHVPIERKETAIRILVTLLFVVIAELVIEIVLGVVILFDLAYTLITTQPPPERVRHFANRTISYLYRILRYITYNDTERPFPFSDFPVEVEPSTAPPEKRRIGEDRERGSEET